MPRTSADVPKFKSDAEEADWYATRRVAGRTQREFACALKDGKAIRSAGSKAPKTDSRVLHQLMEQAKQNATRAISIRVPIADLEQAQRIADKSGVGYQPCSSKPSVRALRERAEPGAPVTPPASVEALHGANHGDDIFHRGSRLNVVNRVEHRAAAFVERLAPAEHLRRAPPPAYRRAAPAACPRRHPRKPGPGQFLFQDFRFHAGGEHCTGLRMSKPASTKEGMNFSTAPQECLNVSSACSCGPSY